MNSTGEKYPPVLVVEDDETIARLLVGHLREIGYLVQHATTQDEALELVRNNCFGMIIADMQIRRINLLELRAEAKRKEKTCDIFPISDIAHETEINNLWEQGLIFDFMNLGDLSQIDPGSVELVIRQRFEYQRRERLQEITREQKR